MWMWIHRRCCRVLLVAGLIGTVAIGDSPLAAQGSYSALVVPYHVRSLSMSSVGTADARGTDITIMNPSLLKSASGALLLSVIRYPADIQSEMVEWRMAWGDRMAAVSLRHLGYGIFDERDEFGTRTGDFSAGETWISFSAAGSLLGSLDVGVTGGFFLSRIETVTATLALFTVGSAITLSRYDMRVGIAIRNVGTTVDSYTNYTEPIPTNVNLGVTKKLAYLPLELSLDGIWWSQNGHAELRLGGEFTLPYDLKLRWGTGSERTVLQTQQLWRDIAAGTSLGVGFQTENLSVDLGILYRGVAGTALGVGFSTGF